MSPREDWRERLVAALPREEIPQFLADLQMLVAALREGRSWQLSDRLRSAPELVLDYLNPGTGRDAVALELQQN